MRKVPLFLAIGLLPAVCPLPAQAAGAANAAVPSGGAGSEVVAKVAGTELTTDDLRVYLDTLPPAERAAIANDPARLGQAVRLYLAQRMVLKEALASKFEQKAETRAQLDRVRDAALSELYLASVVKLPNGFPSDTEVQAAYDANKSAFVLPRQYRLAQIFVKAPKGDGEDKGKLDAVLARLKAKGADFAAIAGEVTDMPAEAGKGGDLGWVAESQLVPEIKAAVAGLAKDAVSDPIRMEDGWHIIKLQDTKAAGTAPLADIKPALIERLRQAKIQQLRQAYLGQLLQKDPPAINELALAKISPKK